MMREGQEGGHRSAGVDGAVCELEPLGQITCPPTDDQCGGGVDGNDVTRRSGTPFKDTSDDSGCGFN